MELQPIKTKLFIQQLSILRKKKISRISTMFKLFINSFNEKDERKKMKKNKSSHLQRQTFPYPVNTRRYLDVDSTFLECQINVKTTLCAYWVGTRVVVKAKSREIIVTFFFIFLRSWKKNEFLNWSIIDMKEQIWGSCLN